MDRVRFPLILFSASAPCFIHTVLCTLMLIHPSPSPGPQTGCFLHLEHFLTDSHKPGSFFKSQFKFCSSERPCLSPSSQGNTSPLPSFLSTSILQCHSIYFLRRTYHNLKLSWSLIYLLFHLLVSYY